MVGTRHPLRTALVAFAAATAAVFALAQLGRVVPWLAANLGAAVAVVFLYVPVAVTWKTGEDLRDYGFKTAPLRRGLLFGLGVPLVVFPLFWLGFAGFYTLICDGASSLRALAPPGWCARFHGFGGAEASALDWGLLESAFVQVVVIALPEELFFRGCLHELCERALPPRRRVLGGGIGWALVLSSALFAAGHLAVGLDPRRLSVFFPGLLFGWMRSATGSILAGTIAHAASNLFIDLLHDMYF